MRLRSDRRGATDERSRAPRRPSGRRDQTGPARSTPPPRVRHGRSEPYVQDRRAARALGRVDGPRGQRDGSAVVRRRLTNKGRRRTVTLAVATTLFLGVLFVAVFPTRTMLQQRSDTRAASAELAALGRERAALRKKVAEQNDPATIEQRAREQGWVWPWEESYSILPAPVPAIGLPDTWPFTGLEQLLTSRP